MDAWSKSIEHCFWPADASHSGNISRREGSTVTGLNTKRAITPQRRSSLKRPNGKRKILTYQLHEGAVRSVDSATIGIIVPNLYDSSFRTCAHAISTVAKRHGYFVFVASSADSSAGEQKQVQLMLRQQVHGLVIIPVCDNTSSYKGKNILDSSGELG
jgi:hypothetical protein